MAKKSFVNDVLDTTVVTTTSPLVPITDLAGYVTSAVDADGNITLTINMKQVRDDLANGKRPAHIVEGSGNAVIAETTGGKFGYSVVNGTGLEGVKLMLKATVSKATVEEQLKEHGHLPATEKPKTKAELAEAEKAALNQQIEELKQANAQQAQVNLAILAELKAMREGK